MSNDKTAYPQVDPLTQMVFAKGNTTELINIAKINSSLEKVVVDNIEFAHAQRFADASSKMNNDTKTDAPHHMVEDKPFMSTGMMIGLGAITIGGIALAAGGGGSSSGTGVGSGVGS